MAFIPTAGAATWAVRFQLAARQMEITGAMAPGHAPVTVADMSAMATVLDTWTRTTLLTDLSSELTYTAVHLEAQDSSSAPVFDLVAATPVPGDVVAVSVPANAAFVVTKQSVFRGRGFRGRWFVPGVSAGFRLTATEWTLASVASFQSIFQTLVNDSNSFAVPQVILHRHENKLPLAAGVIVYVSSIRANERIGAQRRRTGGF